MKYGFTCNGKLLTTDYSNILGLDYTDPLNPLDLPPYTIRIRWANDETPSVLNTSMTLVDAEQHIWDVTYNTNDWFGFCRSDLLIEVLGANTTGVTKMTQMFDSCHNLQSVALFDTSSVTDMSEMFWDCRALASVPLFDTSNVTNMYRMFTMCTSLITVPLFNTSKVIVMNTMFSSCTSLTTVPLFDTSNVERMISMFYNCSSLTSIPLFNLSKITTMQDMFNSCRNVASGALALYQQASALTIVPIHDRTFKDCGIDTQTGSAELAQIPDDWK